MDTIPTSLDTGPARILLLHGTREGITLFLEPRLRERGCIVVEMHVAAEAARHATEDAFDVIVTDEAGIAALPPADSLSLPVLLATVDLAEGADLAELLAAQAEVCRERARVRRQQAEFEVRMARARTLLERERARADALLNAVIPIGAALTVEKDLGRLLERILVEAQRFCCADSGSLYLRTPDDMLSFAIVRNETLGLEMGGTSGTPITFPAVPLYDPATGEPNSRYIVAHAAVTKTSVNIADAYQAEGFDFSGTRAFDARTGYRSTSLLTVPLRNGSGDVIGVLQLINALDWQTKEIIPFDANMQQIIEALSRLAAIALEGYIREQRLTEQLQQLRIEIDQAKKARHVAEITETDYFRDLQQKSKRLRERHRSGETTDDTVP